MKRKSKLKKILIPVSLILVAALGLGIWKYAGSTNAEPVNAYPFYYIGMTEYWGDSQESYGPVTTDKIQTVYLSDTQTVTEILVSDGDMVQKGDLLMTFDTTLSDLALERERLAVEKLKLQLEDAKKQLKEINAMKPMKIPTSSDVKDEEVDLGTALKGACQISVQKAFDGSAPEKALICWISGDTAIDDTLFEAVRQAAEEYQRYNAEQSSGSELKMDKLSVVEENTEPTEEPTEEPTVPPTEEPIVPPTEEPAVPPTEEPTVPPTEEPTVPPTEEPTVPPTEEPTEPPVEEPTEPEPTDPPQEPTEPELTVNKYYVIFKVTQDNMSLGQTLVWQGMEVTRNLRTDTYSFKLFDAAAVTDHMKPQTGEAPQTPEIDYGSGYTASQIAQMRSDQQKTIKDLQFQIKMAEAEYKIKQTEVGDGNIYAEIDGQVVSLLSEEEAKMNMQPILKVSGGGGFYVQGSVSELEKGNLQLGQEVTINDWNTGMTYTGTIDSVGDFPASDGYWNGMGNPNASYYPFSVYIDGSADLQEGSYVSVMYSSGAAENGIYLENPFLRTEGGQSFVYVLGEDGKLQQRFVKTGKALWGSYTEILDGLTAEDYVAFPYGKNIRDGVDAVACEDMSQLYS